MLHEVPRSAACKSCCAFTVLCFEINDAAITPTVTTPIIMVDKAFISGDTPNLTALQILIGSVVDEGPVVKDAITKSSKESVKASNHPEITAGAMIGKVTNLNASKGEQPRSSAASSSERSKVTRREDTTTDT
tara:strand:- start:33 stop:431 length:399 start_codon:yes stop_codon:yes gene_type:complete